MTERIKLVQGDTRPSLVCTLVDETSGQIINLLGATPRMKFRAKGSEEVIEVLEGVVTSPLGGQCVFAWSEQSLNVEPGPYEGEVEITFSDGAVQTVYDVLRFYVRPQF